MKKLILIALLCITLVSATTLYPLTGRLWWPNDPSIQVLVISPSQSRVPLTSYEAGGQFPGKELAQWLKDGSACLATSKSSFVVDLSVSRPTVGDYANTVGIQVTSGPCKGYKGWVFHYAALHP